jgi:hypothetical protein
VNPDPMISSRLHAVDEAWPIDEEEQLAQFEASRPTRGTRGESNRTRATRNRAVTVAVAFAVFLLGSVLVWRAFVPVGTPKPAATPSPQTNVQASISTVDTGLKFLEGAVVADGSVWVAGANVDSQRGQLVRIDPATGRVLARIDVPVPGWEFGGAGITAARGSVWILSYPSEANAAQRGSWLYRIDPATNSVADAVRVSDEDPSDLWVDDTGIWILTWAGSDHMTVSSLDPSTYAVLQTTRLETSWSQTIAVAGGHVWVFGSTQGDAPAETLFELDPQTLATIDTIQPTGGSSFFLAVSGDRIWFHHNGLQALDASTGQHDIGPMGQPVDDCCAALTPDEVGGVWVLDPSGASPGLWHVDADGVIDSDETSFGQKVDGQASTFDPASDTLWVVHYDGTVMRVQITSTPSSTSTSPSVNEIPSNEIVQQTIVIQPGYGASGPTVLSPPPADSIDQALTADQALQAFRVVDPQYTAADGATALLGSYTAPSGPDAYRFQDRLAWSYKTTLACPPSPNPFEPQSPPADCTAWLFLDARTGKMLEAMDVPIS